METRSVAEESQEKQEKQGGAVAAEQQQKNGQPDNHESRAKTNQNVVSSVLGYMRGRRRRWQTRKNHKAKQESSYASHLTTQPHTKSDTLDMTLPCMLNQEAPTNSSFKGWSLFHSMETENQTPQKMEDKGVTGLANMRNTCYLNSAIQALRHNTEICSFFLEGKHEQWVSKKKSSPKVELVKGYADLMRALWSGSKPAYVRPQGFLQCMLPAAEKAGFEHFMVPLQHDSHEFLVFLLDQLHEGMAEEVVIDIRRPPPQNDHEKNVMSALEAWKRFFEKQYSPLTEMVYGLMQVTLTCKKCNKCVSNWETFNCLKLPIPSKTAETEQNPPSILEMLSQDLKEEEIEGYACENCKPERTVAIRKAKIWKLPRMISLVVKRFTPDGHKVHTKLKFSEEETISFGSFFSEDSPEPSRNQMYECFATVDHYGSSRGGHYIAQAKSPLSDKWHTFDDETATSLDEPIFGESTYILFLKPSPKKE